MTPVTDPRKLTSSIDLPRHVGIIMDGNGRWASARSLPRFEGHRRGVEAVRRAVRAAGDLGIGYLSLYAFSSENWSRPPQEVDDLMGLLKRFIRIDLADLHKQNVRVRIIGSRMDLASDLDELLDEAEAITRDNTGLTLVIAFNYGARQEIVDAVRKIASQVARGEIEPQAIDKQLIAQNLYTADIPDPDLIIRTSGEQRLSNFMMWQAAYAELVFLPLQWPEFDAAAFDEALRQYGQRERRFGGLASAPAQAMTGS